MDFSPERFEAYCRQLRIDTKERGRIPFTWLGTQRYCVNEISRGLKDDIHTFVILKGRQIGISTIALATDLYWISKHGGLQGAIVTDTDDNRELFRSYVEQYLDSLPKHIKAPIARHNRVQLILKNGSRLVYMVAGTKKKGELGRAKAVNFMHATECSSWGDEEGFASLMNTLAQQNPHRLYVFESTARGYNVFYDAWRVAQESKTQKAIFIGWWRNELYAYGPNTLQYKQFWDGEPTSDERVWIGEVWERYHHNIQPEQLAWWRWYVIEHMKGDEMLALQEMPPTEDYAFQLSGSKFFSAERVNIAHKAARETRPLTYRYDFGLNFEDTRFIETNAENAEVWIWETPAERGQYVLGADPAYGSSEWADEFAASMGRCYADRYKQVLEVGSTHWNEQQFAWVIAHLCGWYGSPEQADAMLILEMLGPGGAVFNELKNLRDKSGMYQKGDPRAGAFDVVSRIRDYLWHRQDSLTGHFAYQWQTNAREKNRMMTTLRAYFEREMLEVNSPYCLQQFRNIHRVGDKIGGEGRAKDDRVIALAQGVIGWNDWIMKEMMYAGRTFAHESRPKEEVRQWSVAEHSVIEYLRRQGIKFGGNV
ncbi:MAG TPA: hypothetical protein VF764_12835 [Steroidobacteraceae bacterium]